MSTAVLGSRVSVPRQRTRPAPSRPASARPAASRPVTARPAPGPLRLTRRGRVVVTLLMLAAVLAAVVAAGARSAATDHPGTPVPTRTVVVHPGDTLWELAGSVASPGQVREVVHQIEELNALPNASLEAGQRIAVPVQ